jgi:hypothetical protein
MMNKSITPLETISATDLCTKEIEPLEFSIDTILPYGLFILAGSSKVGKSWLALDMSNCVAAGDNFWNYPTTQGDVLYLALEDSNKRLQNRLSKISKKNDFHKPTDIHFVTKAQKLGCGLSEQIKGFLFDYPYTKLIIVDTLHHIRNHNGLIGTYSNDYNDMDALRKIIGEYKLSMLLITHNHKSEESDPVNRVYGSAGLTGAVDGIFVIEKRNRAGDTAKLTITNRDTESFEFELQFDRLSCRWLLVRDFGENITEDEMLFEAISTLLDQKQTWSGTATELCEALSALDPSLLISPITLSKTLKAKQEFFRSAHKIICVFKRTKAVRLIELSRNATTVDCSANQSYKKHEVSLSV